MEFSKEDYRRRFEAIYEKELQTKKITNVSIDPYSGNVFTVRCFKNEALIMKAEYYSQYQGVSRPTFF